MKKIQVLVFVAIFSFPLAALAQWGMGVRGGAGIIGVWSKRGSTAFFVNGLGSAAQLGGSAELNISYQFSPTFKLVTGAGWRRRGAGGDINDRDSIGRIVGLTDYSFYNDYLTVPILIQVQSRGKVRFLAQFGPYIDFRFSSVNVPAFNPYLIEEAREKDGFGLDDGGLSLAIGGDVAFMEDLRFSLIIRQDLGFATRSWAPIFSWSSSYLLAGMEYLFD